MSPPTATWAGILTTMGTAAGLAGCIASAPPPFTLPPTLLATPPDSSPSIGERLTLNDAVAIARARAPTEKS